MNNNSVKNNPTTYKHKRISMRWYVFIFLLIIPITLQAMNRLVIISPHRKSIQNELIPKFENYYKNRFQKEIKVEWIDQGGTENDLRFIYNRFSQNKKTSNIDLFWGGGDITFRELENRNLLESFSLPTSLAKEVPEHMVGVSLKSKQNMWYASALSSFGIFFNKKLLQMLKLPLPETWKDLGNPEYFNFISVADPSHSTSSLVMNLIMLSALGWDEGWKLLTSIAGNARKFTHASSDPIKAVISGDAAVATAIDFYANAKVLSLGAQNVGFVLPQGQTIFNSDPIAILKGAPNKKNAEKFVEFILGKEAQKILFLPKGAQGGPKLSTLGRIAINKLSYLDTKHLNLNVINPFEHKHTQLDFDFAKFAKIKAIVRDIIYAVHVAPHRELQQAWKVVIATKDNKNAIQAFLKPPLSEKQVMEYVKKWDDNTLRNKIINQLMKEAQKKYENIMQNKFS